LLAFLLVIFLLVIPAKAGIQPLPLISTAKAESWIPAFAGMTGKETSER
jgi:hypothetical protein